MRSLLFSLLCFACTTLFASNGQVSDFHLPNGLRLIVKQDHRAPVAVFQIWYRVGGSYEPNGITGISHALEHMMFEGTRHYPNESFAKVVAAHGGELNAFTDDDYTAYYELFAAKQIPLSFKMEADRMRYATLSQKAFNKEIQVVMEERRMRYEDRPVMMAYERMRAAAFLSNPYHHMTIGWLGDLQHMTVQDVRAWYHEWYVPNNATIVIVGDVKPQHMLALAKKYFGNIPKRELPAMKPVVDQHAFGKKTVTVKLPAKVPTVFLAYRVPVLTTAEKKWQPYALDMLATILGGSSNSYFVRHLVRGQQVAAIASASYDPFSRLNNILVINASPSQGHTVKQLRKAIGEQIKLLKTKLVDAAELQRIKTQMIAQKVYAQDSISQQATLIGSLVSVGLPWQLSNDYVKHINKVTAQQVQRVARKFLTNKNLTITTLQPLPMKVNKTAGAH